MILDFVWRLRGSIVLEASTSTEAALTAIERLLAKQRKPVTKRGPDYIAFNAPLWADPFGPNWLAMVIYDRGRFWVEDRLEGRCLRFDLRSLHALIFCMSVAAMVFLVGALAGLARGLALGAVAFCWLYGMNILLALARVPGSIRSAVRKA